MKLVACAAVLLMLRFLFLRFPSLLLLLTPCNSLVSVLCFSKQRVDQHIVIRGVHLHDHTL